jgi:hypothetical protein
MLLLDYTGAEMEQALIKVWNAKFIQLYRNWYCRHHHRKYKASTKEFYARYEHVHVNVSHNEDAQEKTSEPIGEMTHPWNDPVKVPKFVDTGGHVCWIRMWFHPKVITSISWKSEKLDLHGSVHHNTNLIEMTNKMQLCRSIYYSIPRRQITSRT